MNVELKDVTLCAADSVYRELTARSLEISGKNCKFTDSIFFSHAPVEGSFRSLQIQELKSLEDYTAFVLKELHRHIQTPFVLVTQWDGYIINPAAWSSEFLAYDYIGATWPWHRDAMKVGNGGFSLRSKRLLEVTAKPDFELLPNLNEDDLICRTYRQTLEQNFGIRFAPEKLAERFSYECGNPQAPTFGFHGFFNFYREVSDNDLAQMIHLMHPSIFDHINCSKLVVTYFFSQRWNPLRTVYGAWRSHFSFEQVRDKLVMCIPTQYVAQCLKVCESLLAD